MPETFGKEDSYLWVSLLSYLTLYGNIFGETIIGQINRNDKEPTNTKNPISTLVNCDTFYLSR